MSTDPQHTEAVAFDPFADEDDTDPGTEAVAFDPFADDEEPETDGETDYLSLIHISEPTRRS